MRRKIGVIDVGGGMRSAYGAGVLDHCLDRGIRFDYGLGVSAGSANVTSFFAGQRGRARRFYTKYLVRPEYMGIGNFLRTGSYLGFDYIYGTLMNHDGEDPLDYAAMVASGADIRVCATDARTGRPRFFREDDLRQDNYDVIKASSCLPVLDKPYVIDGIPYFDGTISDPVPIGQAFADGCTHVVVILTRPRAFRRSAAHDVASSGLLALSYPHAARALLQRAATYNREVDQAERLAAAGRVTILAPSSIAGMHTLKQDIPAIGRLYEQGLHDARALDVLLGE
ncbi:patatin-like phospholipase family protein [Bifidobacterium choloepi]|uniref:Patatin family protein n=1 Tax=Bifidobacterium choloepi TaxID=2614131 RepID=A0A6I5N008_9BIFI|nr:patatin family protein [Bifidobacterium choloepi]NEG69867.1 patatin family protein [Bifidobacterium choloepi]